jgi:hypothetical protein
MWRLIEWFRPVSGTEEGREWGWLGRVERVLHSGVAPPASMMILSLGVGSRGLSLRLKI